MHHAVNCVPHCLDFWIQLAKLENYDNAKLVLNRARKAFPLEHKIWVYAAMLEESEQRYENIDLVLSRAMKVMEKNGQKIKREDWLESTLECESTGNTRTSKGIIQSILSKIKDEYEDNNKRLWLDDIEMCE